jgi:uncharacterized protein DUF4058
MPVHDWTRVDASVFHGFHVTWVAELAGRLNQILPAKYYALPEKTVIGLEPDVVTLDLGRAGDGSESTNGAGPAGHSGQSGLRLTTSPPKVEIALSRPAVGKQRIIAIRRSAGDQVVDVVSPGNKSSGHAIRAFVAKAVELLDHGVHVHVIDLFPPSPRDPGGIHEAIWNAYSDAASKPPNKPLTVAAYAAGDEERAFVDSFAVGDSLPAMPLILEADLYVPAPLEETYMTSFEKFPRRWRDVLAGAAT